MRESFTPEQSIKLMIDYQGEFIESLLKAMHNEESLSKKISADLVFRDWAQRRKVLPTPQTTDIKTTLWRRCSNEIKAQIPTQEFAKWFEPLVIISYDGAIMQLRVASQAQVQYIEQNYIQVLRSSIQSAFGASIGVRYILKNQ